MKKKHWKIIALVLAIALVAGLGWFANGLLGNPISKALATRAAEKTLAETYAGTDFYIDRVGFDFKSGNYYAKIKSPSSVDTYFSLRIDMLGRVYLDTYDSVLKGFNTASRLEQEYRELTDTVFQSPSFPYECDIDYGTLEIHQQMLIDDPEIDDIPDYAIVQDDLIIDQIYNIHELGAQAGHLIVYIDTNDLTIENAAQILLDIRKAFDDARVEFYAIDLTLQYPKPEEGPRSDEYIGVMDFLYSDIYEDGLTERVEQAFEELKAYYAEMDAK